MYKYVKRSIFCGVIYNAFSLGGRTCAVQGVVAALEDGNKLLTRADGGAGNIVYNPDNL